MTRAVPVSTDPGRASAVAISQGIRVGDLLFVSGQVGTDDDGKVVGDDVETQAHQAFRKLAGVLEAGGSSLAHVVKVTIFVAEATPLATIVALRRRYFSEPYPADTLVQVSALARPGLLFEIEAIATTV